MFTGFTGPEQNWSKLPHEFIDALPLVETIGEMKVILYVLRHTWGYHDEEKRISVNEFMHGRKRRKGERIDNGTGLSENTIVNGIKRAVEHGFLVVETDDSDPGRITKYYSLAIRPPSKIEEGTETEERPEPEPADPPQRLRVVHRKKL